MKFAIFAVALAIGVLGSIRVNHSQRIIVDCHITFLRFSYFLSLLVAQNVNGESFQPSNQNFASVCDRLELIALNGDKCITDNVTDVLRYFKMVNKRAKICANIPDIAKSQACYDGAVFDIAKFINDAAKAYSSNYKQTKCANTSFWRLITQIDVWAMMSMWERSADLKQYATVTLPPFKSLGEIASVSVAPVSAAIPTPPKNL